MLEAYAVSLRQTVEKMQNETEEVNYLLERIDIRISGTYIFDIFLMAVAIIITVIAVIVSLRMIAAPAQKVII